MPWHAFPRSCQGASLVNLGPHLFLSFHLIPLPVFKLSCGLNYFYLPSMPLQSNLAHSSVFPIQKLPSELIVEIGKRIQAYSDSHPDDHGYYSVLLWLRANCRLLWLAMDLPPSSFTCEGLKELDYVLKRVRPFHHFFCTHITHNIFLYIGEHVSLDVLC